MDNNNNEPIKYGTPCRLVDNNLSHNWNPNYTDQTICKYISCTKSSINTNNSLLITFQRPNYEKLREYLYDGDTDIKIFLLVSSNTNIRYSYPICVTKKKTSKLQGGYLVHSTTPSIPVTFIIQRSNKDTYFMQPVVKRGIIEDIVDIRNTNDTIIPPPNTTITTIVLYIQSFIGSTLIIFFTIFLYRLPTLPSITYTTINNSQQINTFVTYSTLISKNFILKMIYKTETILLILSLLQMHYFYTFNSKLFKNIITSQINWVNIINKYKLLKVSFFNKKNIKLNDTIQDDISTTTTINDNKYTYPPPQRFIKACRGDIDLAIKRYKYTQKWMKINNIYNIQNRPHPQYRFQKKNICNSICGYSYDGYYIYYEKPGITNLQKQKECGIKQNDLLYHFVYISEYQYQRQDKRENAKCITIIDCANLYISNIANEVMSYMREVAYVTSTHYPERSHTIFCINVTQSFRIIWKMIRNFIDIETQKKVQILGKQSSYLPKLLQYIDSTQIPLEYGGTLSTFTRRSKNSIDFPTTFCDSIFNNISLDVVSIEEDVSIHTYIQLYNDTQWARQYPHCYRVGGCRRC